MNSLRQITSAARLLRVLERVLALVTFAVAQGLSIYFSVGFCQHLAIDSVGPAPVVAGLIVEGAKLMLAVAAVNRFRDRAPLGGAACLICTVALSVASALATTSFFVAGSDQRTHAAHRATEQLARLDGRVEHLERERDLLVGLAEVDARHSYRARALKVQPTIAALRADIARLEAERSAVVAGSRAALTSLGRVTGHGSLSLWLSDRQSSFTLGLAVLLEAIGVLALHLACRRRCRGGVALGDARPPGHPLPVDATAGMTVAPNRGMPVPEPRTPMTGARCRLVTGTRDPATTAVTGAVTAAATEPGRAEVDDFAELCAAAADLVASGRVRPTQSTVRAALGVSQARAKCVMHTLVEQRVLQRVGRRYVLRHSVRAAAASQEESRAA